MYRHVGCIFPKFGNSSARQTPFIFFVPESRGREKPFPKHCRRRRMPGPVCLSAHRHYVHCENHLRRQGCNRSWSGCGNQDIILNLHNKKYLKIFSRADTRNFAGIGFDDFSEAIKTLNRKGVDYVISYDGECGGKEYGNELPQSLKCTKFLLNAGRSTQATLSGKRDTTYEALYISENIAEIIRTIH